MIQLLNANALHIPLADKDDGTAGTCAPTYAVRRG